MTKQLKVDPIECDGHGLCAELFPEWIALDDWGYPLIDERPIPAGLEGHARRAIKECPKLALRFSSGGHGKGRAGRARAAAPGQRPVPGTPRVPGRH